MSLGVAIPAMAATPLPQAQVGLTKEIYMPPGTTTPASTFTFTQMNEGPIIYPGEWPSYFTVATTITVDMPDRTITFAAGAPNVDQWWSGAPDSAGRHGNILDGVTWPHAGVFNFLVRETANTNSTTIGANPNETMNYDDSAFIMRVQVSNCPYLNIPVPTTVVIHPGVPPTEGSIYWDTEAKLYDVTPGTPGTDDETSVVYPSDMRFVNEFIRTITPPNGPTVDNAALVVSKTIDAQDFDQANLTTLFDFTLNLTAYAPLLPDTALPNTLGAVIVGPDGATPVANFADRINYTVATTTGTGATSTATVTFQLRHGESLLIPTLAAGTTWAATEAAHADFMPRAEVTVGGVTPPVFIPGPAAGTFQSVNTALPTGDRILTDVGTTAGGANGADFVNRYAFSAITGLVIGSMPVLVALIAATLVLAMMVASRSRSRIEQMPAF